MQCATSSFGLQSFEEPPSPGDPPHEIAQYAWFLLCDAYWRAPTRPELRAYCEGEGYAWNHVVRHRRRLRILQGTHDADPQGDTMLPSGIVLKKAEMAKIGDLKSTCPFTLRGVHTWTFQRVSYVRACGSWCCPSCGPRNAEDLVDSVRRRIASLPEVFVAEVKWHPSLAARMRRRVADRNLSLFWYRRIDDAVFYVANKPFAGTSEPTSCRPVPPEDALDWLAEDVMWVPGHTQHDFLGGWEVRAEKFAGGDLLSMAGLNDREVAEVMTNFNDQAERRFGFRPDCGEIPRERRKELVALLKKLRDDKRKERSHGNGAAHG